MDFDSNVSMAAIDESLHSFAELQAGVSALNRVRSLSGNASWKFGGFLIKAQSC